MRRLFVLALTFANPLDYERVLVDDKVDIVELDALAPGRRVKVVLRHVDGSTDEIETTHTMSEEHIAWFIAGSALNLLAAQQAK